MSHEMIHLYDTCKFDVDFSNLRHHACTEVSSSFLRLSLSHRLTRASSALLSIHCIRSEPPTCQETARTRPSSSEDTTRWATLSRSVRDPSRFSTSRFALYQACTPDFVTSDPVVPPQKCVRRRAILSVEGNPHCPSRDEAVKAVDEVWASCKADTRPFDEVFKL